MTPDLILGPPGTGKTETLLGRVEACLARGVPPDRICYITFTKRGATEAAERAAEKFKLSRTQLRWFRTIHSLCFQATGAGSGDILEGKKIVEFGDWIGVELSESFSMDEGTTFGFKPGDRALFMENLARVRCVPLRQQYDEYPDNLQWSFVERLSRGLAQFKIDRGLRDFTDLLQDFLDGDWCPIVDELFVDEAQDLSEIQWRVVWRIAEGVWERGGKVTIAGDDDQAIYRWAGAAVERFIDMPGNVQVLDLSYRVPQLIQDLAGKIINRVRHRRPKVWRARTLTPELREKGLTLQGEIARVQSVRDVDVWGEDVLILGRNAFTLRPVLEHLRREGCVYEWRGHPSVSRATMAAVTAWEALRAGKQITADEARTVYGKMSSGKGVARGFKTLQGFEDTDLVSLQDLKSSGGLLIDTIWHQALDRIPTDERTYMLRARQKGEKLTKKPRVRVSTIHGSKGGQSDHVVLFRDMASRTFQEMQVNPEDEHRVQFVGASRTRQKLTVVAPSSRTSYDL